MEVVEHFRVNSTPGHLDDDPRMDTSDKDQMSDCASETSEVLSVGSEPTPATDNIKDCQPTSASNHIISNSSNFNHNHNHSMSVDSMPNTSSRLDYQTEAMSFSSSRTPSPSPSSGSASNHPPSPQSSCSLQRASSPTPSIRSPASSHATQASSPIQGDIHETIVSRYQMSNISQQHLLSRYTTRESELDFTRVALGGHDTAFSAIENRLHHRLGVVPIVTRLSPPTAAVPLASSVFRPACRDLRETSLLLHPVPLHGNLLQHHATASMLHHHHQKEQEHRLSISKLIARDSKSPQPSDEEPAPAGNILANSNHSSNSNHSNSNSNHSNSNSNSHNNHNHHHHSRNRNNGNNNDIQGNLKFSIDNILKADFGRRITDPISIKKSRPKKIAQKPIDLTKEFLESGTESSSDKVLTSDLGTNGCSSNSSNVNNNPSCNGSNNGSGNSATGSTQLTSPSTTNASLTSTPASGDSSKQMLWPAWVYCTRYSDRPSSGEF